MSNFIEVTAEMVMRSDEGAKMIAERVGKPYATLMRELNDADEGAKLGANLIIPLMSACDCTDPLNYLARQTGYRLVSMQSVCPAKSLGEEALDTLPALSRFVEAITNSSTRDHAAAHSAMQDAIREIEEAYEAYRAHDRRESPRFKK
jgi:hypothetical protein